jgi:hypothetical protein
MAQKPPAWTRSDAIGQVPLMLSRDVDATSVHPSSGRNADILADEIIREHQPVINRFVAKQRQQIEISGRDVHNAVLPLPDMDVHYSHVQGFERMHYHISPQAEALKPEPPLEELKIPTPPEMPELELPEIPKFEIPEIPEEPERPEELEKPVEELVRELEKPKVPEEEAPRTPDFLITEMMFGLAVEFGDGAGDP